MPEGYTGSHGQLNRSEVIAKHLAQVLVSAVENVPVRFVPTAFGRHMVVSRASMYAFLHKTYWRSSGDLSQELSERDEQFPSVDFARSIAVLAARDSYWLGAGANAVLKKAKIPKAERPDRIAASTGLLLHSYGPEAPVRRRRSISRTDNWGRGRLKSDKLEMNADGRVQYKKTPREFLRDLQQENPESGCAAHNVRQPGETSPVVLYWRTYTRKVFTPWGKKR